MGIGLTGLWSCYLPRFETSLVIIIQSCCFVGVVRWEPPTTCRTHHLPPLAWRTPSAEAKICPKKAKQKICPKKGEAKNLPNKKAKQPGSSYLCLWTQEVECRENYNPETWNSVDRAIVQLCNQSTSSSYFRPNWSIQSDCIFKKVRSRKWGFQFGSN